MRKYALAMCCILIAAVIAISGCVGDGETETRGGVSAPSKISKKVSVLGPSTGEVIAAPCSNLRSMVGKDLDWNDAKDILYIENHPLNYYTEYDGTVADACWKFYFDNILENGFCTDRITSFIEYTWPTNADTSPLKKGISSVCWSQDEKTRCYYCCSETECVSEGCIEIGSLDKLTESFMDANPNKYEIHQMAHLDVAEACFSTTPARLPEVIKHNCAPSNIIDCKENDDRCKRRAAISCAINTIMDGNSVEIFSADAVVSAYEHKIFPFHLRAKDISDPYAIYEYTCTETECFLEGMTYTGLENKRKSYRLEGGKKIYSQ